MSPEHRRLCYYQSYSLESMTHIRHSISCFFYNDTATTEIYTLSLHDALPISTLVSCIAARASGPQGRPEVALGPNRSEEHTSELQSRVDLVCRLLLEKKKNNLDVTLQQEYSLIPLSKRCYNNLRMLHDHDAH